MDVMDAMDAMEDQGLQRLDQQRECRHKQG
jgi:hypothetical protein